MERTEEVRNSFIVSTDQADRRLDRVLRGLYPDVPLGAIMRSIRKGQVRLNGARTKGDERLSEGDEVFVPWVSEIEEPFIGNRRIEFPSPETLYRDVDIWCVEKEAGLLSQPGERDGDSLITRIWTELSWVRRDFRPALIHRLDRNVSGVVAIALNAPILRTLAQLLREERIVKLYRALVHGSVPPFGEISFSLYKDEKNNRVSVDARGKAALTKFRRISSNKNVSLVELELVTGRPHQARVHLASIGHPILGDLKYGGERFGRGAGRLMLHACTLSFPDCSELPVRIRGLTVQSPLPSSFGCFTGLPS